MAMTADEWIAQFAEALGLEPPTRDEIDTLLAVASSAAHGSERTAAPVTCYLVGRAGVALAEAAEIARRLEQGTEA